MRVTDTASFIVESNVVHGNKYDYSKSNYTKSSEKLEIICKEHGSFWQQANSHLNGRGCYFCAKRSVSRKLSNENLIIGKFKNKHKDRFCYSEVVFKNMNTKVKIKCKKHGIFEQTPRDHLMYSDCCPGCSRTGKLTTEVFKERAMEKHGDLYDYSESVYVSSKELIKIKCKTHGAFFQAPANHINAGHGCPHCSGNARKDKSDFIKRAKSIHKNKYGYDNVVYTNNSTKVRITCFDHGDFMQSPSDHLRPNGCKLCGYKKSGWSRGKFELACEKNNGYGYLYLVKCFSENESFFKIGITSQKINQRFAPSHMPYKYEVLSKIKMIGREAWDKENETHKALRMHKYTPKIRFKGDGECFSIISNDVFGFFGINENV